MKTQDSTGRIFLIPTREEIEQLKVGDDALDCFGKWSRVTDIICGGREDVKGKLFICFYTAMTHSGEISGTYKEGELVRTVSLSSYYNSNELRIIEERMNKGLDISNLLK